MKIDWKQVCMEILGAIAFCAFWWVLLTFQGCNTQKCVPEKVEVHDTIVRIDSVYKTSTRDSIVYRDRHDSTYIKEKDSMALRSAGDTIYVVQYRTRYEYIYRTLKDQQTKTESEVQSSKSNAKDKSTKQEVIVKTERYIPKFYKFTMWIFWIIVAYIVLRLAWWVCGKIPATKPYVLMVEQFFKNFRIWQQN